MVFDTSTMSITDRIGRSNSKELSWQKTKFQILSWTILTLFGLFINSKFINLAKVPLVMSKDSINPVPTDEEIVKQYWKWLCSIPRPINPAIDNDGDKDEKANNPNNEYVFLSFVLGGGSRRICTIPYGKKVVIPSLSCISSEAERPGSDDDDLRRFADIDHDNIEYRRIEIDGKPLVGDLDKRFRIRTKPFDVEYPEKAIFNARPGRSRAVADGVYVVWAPPKGEHIIHFEGKIDVPEEEESLEHRDYVEDVTYTLKVN